MYIVQKPAMQLTQCHSTLAHFICIHTKKMMEKLTTFHKTSGAYKMMEDHVLKRALGECIPAEYFIFFH